MNKTNFSFKKYNVPSNWLGLWLFTYLNKLQIEKAKHMAREGCRSDGKRRYVVDVFGQYAVIESTDIAKANRSGKHSRMKINTLLEEALFIADQNNLAIKN